MTALHALADGLDGRRRGLFALLAAGGLLWLVANVAPLDWEPPSETEVLIDEAHYVVGEEDIRWLESFSHAHFSSGREEAGAIVAAEIDARLEAVFAAAAQRTPEFLDWYFSLRGEYSRVAMTALATVDLADPGYVGERAAAMLLPEEGWLAELEALEAEAVRRLAEHDEQVRAGWLAGIVRRLEPHRVPAPLPGAVRARPTIEFDGLLGEIAASERWHFPIRQGASAGASIAAALVGPALARAAAARGGRAAARAAAGATRATRAAASAGSVGTAAAGGAAVCAPGGPAAAVCALLAGAGAWLATDWALLRLDEALNRDDLERALETTLAEIRAGARADLLATYDALVADRYARIDQEISRTFVPADAGRPRIDDIGPSAIAGPAALGIGDPAEPGVSDPAAPGIGDAASGNGSPGARTIGDPVAAGSGDPAAAGAERENR